MLMLQKCALRCTRMPIGGTNLCSRLMAPASASVTNWNGNRSLHISTKHTTYRKGLLLPTAILPFAPRFEGTVATVDAVQKSIGQVADAPAKTFVELPNIPEPPPIPDQPVEVVKEVLNALGEPTLASLGLGGWTPPGIVQTCLEMLHVNCDIPWWATIVIGTVVVRSLVFPLVIIAQRNAAKLNNNLPQMQVLQMKMTEARQTGDALNSARYAQEMMHFMKDKQINPLKNMLVPLAQAPVFISFFMGLREMANTPVMSMRDGGLFWFTDLTIADPYYLLPTITCATLYLTIELGTDSAKLTASNMFFMKYALRALPLVIFPFTMNFPAAILCYWASSNFVSLGQVAILKIPVVREFFKIEKLVSHPVEALPAKKKNFVGGVKESWQNMKITRELQERARIDEIRFARAGQGPLVKTYKYDPTKQKDNNPPLSLSPKKID